MTVGKACLFQGQQNINVGSVANRADGVERIADVSQPLVTLNEASETFEGPTFVFLMGLEGVGHHLTASLLKNSPNMAKIRNLGLCHKKKGEMNRLGNQLFFTQPTGGLFNPLDVDNFDSVELFHQFVNSMANISEVVKKHGRNETYDEINSTATSIGEKSPFHIAINANGGCGGDSMMSYPTYKVKHSLTKLCLYLRKKIIPSAYVFQFFVLFFHCRFCILLRTFVGTGT